MIDVPEYRLGRNVIRPGDRVRVHSAPGRRNGFDAVVHAIRADEDTSEIREIHVLGGRRGCAVFRAFRPERIQRLDRHRQAGR